MRSSLILVAFPILVEFESRLALFFNGWNSLDLQGVPAFCVLQNVVDSCRHFSFCPVGEKAVWFDPRLALLLCKKTDFQRWKSVFELHPKVYHILLFIDRLADLVCKRNEVVIVIDSFVADHDILQCGERLRRD